MISEIKAYHIRICLSLLVVAHFATAPVQAQYAQQGEKLAGALETGPAQRGYSVALSADGNSALIGAPGDPAVGAASVYKRNVARSRTAFRVAPWPSLPPPPIWTEVAKLDCPPGNPCNGSPMGGQGFSVALSADGHIALIGGPNDNFGVGAAWMFGLHGWQSHSKLVGTQSSGPANQGTSVALSATGATALVGGPSDSGGRGAAWVFAFNGGQWVGQGKLVGSNSSPLAFQGWSVALSADGTTALLGAPNDNGTGAVWVFNRGGSENSCRPSQAAMAVLCGVGAGNPSDAWTEQAKLAVPPGPVSFGYSVALSKDGNTALIGSNGPAFAAWVYVRDAAGWTRQGTLAVSTGDRLSVALSGDGNTALVGAPGTAATGAAWVFMRDQGVWSQQRNALIGAGASGNAQQGWSVAISADASTALLGGPIDSFGAGAAWPFIRAAVSSGAGAGGLR